MRLAVLLAALVLVPVASAGYAYHGGISVSSATLSLDSADVRSGQVAVWLGADDGQHWIQAGVAAVPGSTPFVYVEWRGDRRVWFPVREIGFGDRVAVRLTHRRTLWYVTVLGRRYGPVNLVHAHLLATGESWVPDGPANLYTATITGGR